MKFFYQIGIRAYAAAIAFAAPFNAKASEWIRGRRNWRENLKKNRETGARYIWFHCASLGEFEQGRPLLEAIRKDFPHYRIALSFFSPSGYSIRKNYDQAELIHYLPLDTAGNARDYLEILQPELAIFVKYEVWPEFFLEMKTRTIPLVMLSASFRPDHRYFKKSASWLLDLLKIPQFIFVQNSKSLDLLKSNGIQTAIMSGDTRFDRVLALKATKSDLSELQTFAADRKLIVFGSSWEKEEELAALLLGKISQDWALVIVPHDISVGRIESLNSQFAADAQMLSKLSNQTKSKVLIVDSIGLLGKIYGMAELAVVGGGFRGALHNILEPAVYGIPVCFGNNHDRYPEAADMLEAGGAIDGHDPRSLFLEIMGLINDKERLKICGMRALQYIEANTGATDRVLKVLKSNELLRN